MQYPSKFDYDNAVWNLSKTIRCNDFEGGVPRNDGLDLVFYTGGFSRVYLIDMPNHRTSVLRVWLNEVPNAQSLYSQAGAFFKRKPNPYFVDFRFIPNGIEVNKRVWPILYMEWVNGTTLNKFLDNYLLHSPEKIRFTANQFLELTRVLHREQISHGDLQDGNILVTNDNNQIKLKLIDYDTLYIATFREIERLSVGLSGFQHPKRLGQILNNMKWDYFSELVIYLSLRAYAENNSLWKQKQERSLLFSKKDFDDPNKSPVIHQLKSMSTDIRFLADKLIEYCLTDDLNRLIPIEDLVDSLNVKNPFYFRNGKSARTVEELVRACEGSIDDAIYHFSNGHFEPWLEYINRLDLSTTAREMRTSAGLPFNNLILFLDKTEIEHRVKITNPVSINESSKQTSANNPQQVHRTQPREQKPIRKNFDIFETIKKWFS